MDHEVQKMLQKDAIIPAQSNTNHFLILVFEVAEDTVSHYDLAWRKWNSWCGRRQVNPITCPQNFLSDFLTQCYHENFHFNTLILFLDLDQQFLLTTTPLVEFQ